MEAEREGQWDEQPQCHKSKPVRRRRQPRLRGAQEEATPVGAGNRSQELSHMSKRTLSLSARGSGDADLSSLKERSSTTKCGIVIVRGRPDDAGQVVGRERKQVLSRVQGLECNAAHEVRVQSAGDGDG